MSGFLKSVLWFFLLISSALGIAKDVWIVVPGTYSADYDWYQPEGDFFKSLESGLVDSADACLVPFRWSGGIRGCERMRAARMLKKLVQSYSKDTRIHIVAHSHGGNVALVSTQLLGRDPNNSASIDTIYLLGTPIDPAKYRPDYSVVGRVINLFSFNDDVQPVFNWFRRELPWHEQCANFRAFLDGKAPTHITIHDPVIARWLPTLGKSIELPLEKNSQSIYFTSAEPPRKAPDYFCDILKREDRENHNGYWYHLGSFKRNLLEWFELSPDNFTFQHFKKTLYHLHLACAHGLRNAWNKLPKLRA